MATLVCFHAHPDDEAISTGGVMALAAAAGHRVVLVTATRGEHGEPVPGVLDDGEELWQRRVVETHRAGEILGVERVEFLGYVDSGMMGEPTNDHPESFWQADVDEAAARLAAILRDVDAEILTIYDEHGGYGHPDHIQVHRVGRRAAELLDLEHVFEATMNRDHFRRLMALAQEMGVELDDEAAERQERVDEETFGSPEHVITHAVDVTEALGQKRGAMTAHASQIDESSFFLKMPEDAFARAFGVEWFIRVGASRPEGAPFDSSLGSILLTTWEG